MSAAEVTGPGGSDEITIAADAAASAVGDVQTVKAFEPWVGRYRLCFELAAGGMAMVYLATTEGPGGFSKVVALKLIHRHLAREREFIEMFLDEARIASRLHHPNVCTVFDFGEASGDYYIAMEYLLGESVSRVVRAIAKQPEERDSAALPFYLCRVIADACEGLHAAHELKGPTGEPLDVVHRDVSPQNLFLTYAGVTKVVDFGVASARHKVHHTVTGTLKGKHGYMAPEQLRLAAVERGADVWALGVVLWEALTSRRLFRRETEMDTMLAALEFPVPPPSRLNPRVPHRLDVVVLKALERDPGSRYRTAREFGRDLEVVLAAADHRVGRAELAEWMERLFTSAQVKKQQLVDLASQMQSAVPVAYDPEGTGSSAGGVAVAPAVAPPANSAGSRWGRPVLLGFGAVALSVVAFAGGSLWDRGESGDGRAERPISSASASFPDEVRDAPAGGATGSAGEPRSAEERREEGTSSAEVGATADPDLVPQTQEPRSAGSEADVPETDSPETDATEAEAEASDPGDPEPGELGPSRAAAAETRPATAHEEPRDSGGAATARGDRTGRRGPGRLAIVTPGGWANVYDARGRLLGPTPLNARLRAGRQTLRIQPFGEGPRRALVVRVRAGAVTRRTVRLD